jgi:hypothetical protein
VTTHTGKYEERTVTIHNGRLSRDDLSLEREGFILVDRETKVKNFYDEGEVRSFIIRNRTAGKGNDRGGEGAYYFRSHVARRGRDDTRGRQMSAPVRRVHNDYTEWSGPQRVRDLLPADEAVERLQHRFAVIQVWRPIRHSVESAPLAIADARSLAPANLIATERRYPDRVGEIYHITYNHDHDWFYFPHMQTNEALVFKTYGSATDGRARWTAHAAFDDPTSEPEAPDRESIEVRTLAFFTPEAA